MAFPLSETLDHVASLRESARRGDWDSTGTLAAALPQFTSGLDPADLGACLDALKGALIVARASRAHAAASLARLTAAAGFNHTRAEYALPRQEFGEAADF